MIYTTTTTGMVTSYQFFICKFVTSLANLFDVFFIVIFINVLISSLGRRSEWQQVSG